MIIGPNIPRTTYGNYLVERNKKVANRQYSIRVGGKGGGKPYHKQGQIRGLWHWTFLLEVYMLWFMRSQYHYAQNAIVNPSRLLDDLSRLGKWL